MTTKMTDNATLAAIGAATIELHLPTVRAEAARRAETANRQQASYLVYLADVLAAETRRPSRTTAQPAHSRSALPSPQTPSRLRPGCCTHRQPGHHRHPGLRAYLSAGEPVVLLGESGTGKSHLLIALGVAACEQGRRVRYVTAAQLVNELAKAAYKLM